MGCSAEVLIAILSFVVWTWGLVFYGKEAV